MAVAGLVAMRLVGQTIREAGLVPKLREAPIAILMVPIGLALGVLFYLLLDSRGPARDLATGGAGLLTAVALVVILNPGVVDEIVFRGVLRRSTAAMLGTTPGLVYGSLLYAPVLPVGLVNGGSLVGVALTFGSGLLFGLLTARTGSILSATVAHAALAIGLFVLAPSLMPNGLAPGPETSAAPSATPPAGSPAPVATKPVVVVSPPATAAAQPNPAAPPPATTGPQQPGQPPPGGLVLATPISLATPGAGAPFGVPQPPPAQPGGQIVVVRGTGGSGARLRSQPGNNGPIVVVLPEYTPLVVIGPDRTVDGLVWRNVRVQSGNEGWIAANFVASGP
jgi:membrane protease YdiL (CAAX protease family)